MEGQKRRILVVDDEPSITRILKRSLEATGRYEVCCINAARQALTSAHEFRPDLILLDVMMPEIDGGALASEIQADPILKYTPVVFLTAAATKQEVSNHRGEIGGLPFLAKPVDFAEVMACLEHFLPCEKPK